MTIAQLRADLKTKLAEYAALDERIGQACTTHVVTPATATAPAQIGRLRTAEERAQIDAVLAEARTIQTRIDGIAADARMTDEFTRLTAGMSDPTPSAPAARDRRGSMGAQFVNDPALRAWLKAGGHQAQGQINSPGVDLHATLLDSSGGSGGSLVQPDYQPGILQILARTPAVADLIAPGTTDSNLISYMKELAATNAAAAVAEGAEKPQSALSFVAATAPVVKIATWIPATTEILEDYPGLQSMIDARLRMFLALAEDDQLLSGSGVAPNMRGLRNLLGLAAAVVRGTDTIVDAMFKQMSAIGANALIQPDGWTMNPTDWGTVQLSKDANENYYGAGPFTGPQPPMLWGYPGAITPAMPVGEALVGAFRTCAQFFRRGGVRAAISNSHLDYFTTNKVAILIEERGALVVYRDAAFGKVTGLNAA